MQTELQLILIGALVATGGTIAAHADDAVAVSPQFAYSIDTRPSPRAVKTTAELEEIATRPIARRDGETIALTAPDGSETVLDGATLSLASGGVWTLENSRHGKAVFTVRRSLDGTLGAGTAESPAKIVDGDELVDYAPQSGYTFSLDDAEGLFASLRIPTGFRLERTGDNLYRIVASGDGREYSSATVSFTADTRVAGPDRTTSRREAPPIAYTGDGWVCNATMAAALTFVAPDGTETDFDLSGTDAFPFQFRQPGDWTVRLEMADGTVLSSVVTVSADGFVIVFR